MWFRANTCNISLKYKSKKCFLTKKLDVRQSFNVRLKEQNYVEGIAVTNFFDVFHSPVCKVQNVGGETLYKATVRQRESPFLNR